MVENSKNMQEVKQPRIVIASQWKRICKAITGILTKSEGKQRIGLWQPTIDRTTTPSRMEWKTDKADIKQKIEKEIEELKNERSRLVGLNNTYPANSEKRNITYTRIRRCTTEIKRLRLDLKLSKSEETI
ncbi:hypothetical protein Barb6XT_02900 [Bacteroidales bacterium Barb6XT]|nr:hypothetical protein Barb6XT_02900 [Bacteroidales bacterium Barb6XT]